MSQPDPTSVGPVEASAGPHLARTAGERSVIVDMRHMVETHWTEQRSEDQIDYLDD